MSKTRRVQIVIIFILFVFTGCKQEKMSMEKIDNINYTIEDFTEIPNELEEEIANKRYKKFSMVYKDDEEMYICIGYGRQSTGGYSIKINDVYLSSNAVIVDSSLVGPKENELVLKAYSYPCIVFKIKSIDKKVIFV